MPTPTRLSRVEAHQHEHGRDDAAASRARTVPRPARGARAAPRPSVVERPPARERADHPQPGAVQRRQKPPRRSRVRWPAASAGRASSMRPRRQPHLVDARDVAAAVAVHEIERERGDADARPAQRQRVSTPLSTTRCWSSRPRDAPSAPRIASSRLRSSARAISRLTAFAQAMSSTQPTAASTTKSVDADVADDARLEILQAPRRLLVLIRRLPDRERAGAFVARSASSAAARRRPGAAGR